METKKLELNTLRCLHMLVDSHFMYNVLNSLQGGVLVDDVEENFRRFQLFSSFYRGMNHGITPWRSADKEWAFIEKYMKLEKERFMDETVYNIPDVRSLYWKERQVPTFLIQPFLENEWQKKRVVQEEFSPNVSIKDSYLHLEITYKNAPETEVHDKLKEKCALFKERVLIYKEENEHMEWMWSGENSKTAFLKLKLK